jgi:hypothetical protein
VRSNFRQALGGAREGFLLTRPRSFTWVGERHYIDDVRVSERVYQLAYDGNLQAARAAWLEEWDAAAAALKGLSDATA